MPLPALLLPLLMAAGGAGLGAMANKKNRGKGALIGAGLGALGGAGLGAAGVGAGGAAAAGAKAAGSSAGMKSILNMQNVKNLHSMLGTIGSLGGAQQEEQLEPFPWPTTAQPMPIASLNPGAQRPMAPPVQTNLPYKMPYGGY